MKVVIVGAGGLVGSRLAKYFSAGNVAVLTHRELDISDREKVFGRLAAERPDVIFNCAVIGVDQCERDPRNAYAVNVAGPRNLAEAASSLHTALVHFSTNYVFDGERMDGFYTIEDEPNPVNTYGQTKWKGEQAVAAACAERFIMRTSWVYGGGTKGFFDSATVRLKRGENVEAIGDNWANTTFVGDLVERVVQIVATRRYGTYHVVNEGVCSKHEFAVEAAYLLTGSDDLVKEVGESECGLNGRRPRYTPMRCLLSDEVGLSPLRNWRTALKNYVN